MQQSEVWLCKSITAAFGSNYICYTYKDLNRAFFNGNGYRQTISEALDSRNKSFSNLMLHHIIDLIKGPVSYSEQKLRFIHYACIAMGIPLMHVLFFCDECYEHQIKLSFEKKLKVEKLALYVYKYLILRNYMTVIGGTFAHALFHNVAHTTKNTHFFIPYDRILMNDVLKDLTAKIKFKEKESSYEETNSDKFGLIKLKIGKRTISIFFVKEFHSKDKYKFVRHVLNNFVSEKKFCVTEWRNIESGDNFERPQIHFTVYIRGKLHPNVETFVRIACRSTMLISNKPERGRHVKYFNAIKQVYQNNFRLHSLYAAITIINTQREEIGNFESKFIKYEITNYDDKRDMITIILETPCLAEYRSAIKLERSVVAYTKGTIIGNNVTKLGNFLAVYNAFIIKYCRETKNEKVIAFDYEIIKSRESQPKKQSPFEVNEPVYKIIDRLTKNRSLNLDFHHEIENRKSEYTQSAFNDKIKNKLSINYDMDSKKDNVFAVFTGIVVHTRLFVTKPICKAKIINKPLVRFINKHKTMTCSYYKELSDRRKGFPQDVKVNFNLQGADFFIRSKLLAVYDNLHDKIIFGGKTQQIKVSNQCAHIRGIHHGILNAHNFRDKLLKSVNCFKIPSFPGLRLVDESQTTDKPRDNLIHRETVLTRIHKTHDMIENINRLTSQIYPHSERDEILHKAIYNIESNLKFVLHGTLLGILKMYYLYYGEEGLEEIFNALWINQYIVAQNGLSSRAPMCHEIKETTAIKTTSIKTAKTKKGDQNPYPPIVFDPELFQELVGLFNDIAVDTILSPKLWKKRGAFNYITVLMQAPTKIVYGPLGKRIVFALYELLHKRGGRELFPDCYKFLDVYKNRIENKIQD